MREGRCYAAPAVRTPLLLYALALVVRAVLIALFPYPAYPDSEYYVDVARQLHAGNGFNVDFIWIFAEVGGTIPADPTLPIPSNAHWMPLASIVQVPFLAVFGDVPWAAAAPFALFAVSPNDALTMQRVTLAAGQGTLVHHGNENGTPGKVSLVWTSPDRLYMLGGDLPEAELLAVAEAVR